MLACSKKRLRFRFTPRLRCSTAAALLVAAAGPAMAQIEGDVVRIGVLADMSGLYSDMGGAGLVEAVKMAAADMGGQINGKKIEVISANHSAKPDICFDWFDRHFPSFRKIELNARVAREGWDRWGLEAPETDAAPSDAGADSNLIDGEAFDPETGELPPIWGDEAEQDHAAEAAAESENEAMEAAGASE